MQHAVNRPIYTLVISWVLLLPLLFFAARGTFSFDRAQSGNLGTTEANNLTATRSDSTYYRLEQIVLYAIIIAAMAPWIRSLDSVIRENLFVFSVPCLALTSALWTQSLIKTIPFGVFAILLTVFGIYLTQRFSPDRQIRLLLFAGSVAIVLSYMLALFFPAAGIWNVDGLGAWRGMFIMKNILGEIVVLLSYAALSFRPRTAFHWIGLTLYLVLALGLVVMSQSRTAWIVGVLSLAFVIFLNVFKRFRVHERLLFAVVLGIVLSLMAIFVVAYATQIALALGKDPTLTGRTKIWAAVATVVWKRPLLGFGYRAFWLGLEGESANLALAVGSTSLGNSENALVDIWLELGTIGVLLMLITLFKACRNAITCVRLDMPKHIQWYILIVFFNVLSVVDGDKLMYPHTIEWLLFVVAYVGLSAEARRIRTLRTA